MLLTLFPPNMPMFRMTMNDAALQDAREAAQDMEMSEEQKAWETEVQAALSKYEQVVQAEVEASGDRPSMHEGLLHMLVAGNVLLCDSLETGKRARIFPLTRYAVDRDPMGNWTELVIHERVALVSLPAKTQQRVLAVLQQEGSGGEISPNDQTTLDLYTHVRRVQGDKYEAYQETAGVVIEGTEATYTLDGCPYIPLRMYWVAGEDYGRSYVENYLGDLKSLEALTQAIIEGSAISAKVVFLVNANGTTKPVDLQKAPNGGFVTGSANDITVLQVQKATDLRVALETVQILNNRLAKAFMLMDGVRRDAERVTAEEIRAVASELEAALGGVYSMLAQEFQLPYIKRKILKLTKAGKLPSLPGDMVEPTIITGFEALGRGNDKTKLVGYLTTVAQALGPQVVQQYINVPDFLERLAAADGINTKGLIKDAGQLAQERSQAQQQDQLSTFGPKAMDLVGKLAGGQQNQPPMTAPTMGQGV